MRVNLLIGMGLLIGAFHWSEAFALCVSTPKAELYEGPGKDYPKTAWQLKKYTPLKRLDTWGDWYKIADMDGDAHWIHHSAVVTGIYCLQVKVDVTDLWKGPNTFYAISGQAKKYDSFILGGRQGKWTQAIQENGNTVWIPSERVWVQ